MSHADRKPGAPALNRYTQDTSETGVARLANTKLTPDIFKILIKQGYDPVLTIGASKYEVPGDSDVIATAHPVSVKSDEIKVWPSRETEVNAVLDIAGSFSERGRNAEEVDQRIPVINGPPIRRLDDSKLTAYLSGIYGEMAVPTHDLRDFRYGGETVFVKPNSGCGSRDLFKVSSEGQMIDLIKNLGDVVDERKDMMIVQPWIDNTIPLPSEIRVLDDEWGSGALYDQLAGFPKEIRYFFFNNGSEFECRPLIKVTDIIEENSSSNPIKSRREYVFIDEDSIPSELVDSLGEILNNIKQVTKKDYFSGVIDFAYAKSAISRDPQVVCDGRELLESCAAHSKGKSRF